MTMPRRRPASPASPPPAAPVPVRIRRTRLGWRLIQHGTVLSEIPRLAGPTHSVFDVIAAACRLHPAPRDLALLGFGGGGIVAALRALGVRARIHGVDLDPRGHELLRRAGVTWTSPLRWRQEDARCWLTRTCRRFDVIIDDLSVPANGDVEKPAATWESLPELVAEHLLPGGFAVLNLLRPSGLGWAGGLRRVAAPFAHAVVLELAHFHNRVVIAGGEPRPVRIVGQAIRNSLIALGSNQADRVSLRTLPRVGSPAARASR